MIGVVTGEVEGEAKASDSLGIREFLFTLCSCVLLKLGGIFQDHRKRLLLELFRAQAMSEMEKAISRGSSDIQASVIIANLVCMGSVIPEMKNKRLYTINWFGRLLGLPVKVKNHWFVSCPWEKNGNYIRVDRLETLNSFYLMTCCCK